MVPYTFEESPFSHFLLSDTRSSWLWLIVRLYLGWGWLEAGWEKIHNPAWIGPDAGGALAGFVQNALTKTGGPHPDVQWWYASFLTNAVLPHTQIWSFMVAYGEVLVGLALLVGFLTGISVLFGMTMNFSYMLAGAVSVNPIWFVLSIGIILSWRVSGYIGLDRYVLPLLHESIRPKKSLSTYYAPPSA